MGERHAPRRYVLPDLPWFQGFGSTGVVIVAGEPSVYLRDEEQALTVLSAEGAGTHLTEGGCLMTADVTLVPGTLPTALEYRHRITATAEITRHIHVVQILTLLQETPALRFEQKLKLLQQFLSFSDVLNQSNPLGTIWLNQHCFSVIY